jgi:hypothetical protein
MRPAGPIESPCIRAGWARTLTAPRRPRGARQTASTYMAAVSEIRQLLEQQRPFAHCDACLALHLRISLADSRAAALAVANDPRFSRKRGECYTCRRTVELTSIGAGRRFAD